MSSNKYKLCRLDKYGTLSPSYAECNKNNISIIGKMFLKIFSIFKIIHIEEKSDGNMKCNNLTLINLCLIFVGPKKEKTLTIILLTIQVSFNENSVIHVFFLFLHFLIVYVFILFFS